MRTWSRWRRGCRARRGCCSRTRARSTEVLADLEPARRGGRGRRPRGGAAVGAGGAARRGPRRGGRRAAPAGGRARVARPALRRRPLGAGDGRARGRRRRRRDARERSRPRCAWEQLEGLDARRRRRHALRLLPRGRRAPRPKSTASGSPLSARPASSPSTPPRPTRAPARAWSTGPSCSPTSSTPTASTRPAGSASSTSSAADQPARRGHLARHLRVAGGARVDAGVAADHPRFAAALRPFAEGEVVAGLELVLGRRRLHARPVDPVFEVGAGVARRVDRFEADADVEVGRGRRPAGAAVRRRVHFVGDRGDRFVHQLRHLGDLGDAVEERRGRDREVVLHQVDRRVRLLHQVGVEALQFGAQVDTFEGFFDAFCVATEEVGFERARASARAPNRVLARIGLAPIVIRM